MKKNDFYIGIDIGGTNTVIGLVDIKGNYLAQKTMPTYAHEPVDVFLANMENEIDRLLNSHKNDLKGIGIGAPSVNNKLGLVESPKNFNWGRIDLAQMISTKYQLPVKMINDADAAALGEMYFGIARDLQNFVHITLGTGLGSSIIVNRKILNGQSGFAGELGHTKVHGSQRICSCGKTGCLETYVSANGIRRTAFELLCLEREDSLLRDYPFNQLSPEIITNLALQGDRLAIETYAYTGKILGEKLADVVAFLNPEAIVFSGGITKAGDLLFEPAQKAMEQNLLPIHKNTVEIRISRPDKNYAVLGSAALLMENNN